MFVTQLLDYSVFCGLRNVIPCLIGHIFLLPTQAFGESDLFWNEFNFLVAVALNKLDCSPKFDLMFISSYDCYACNCRMGKYFARTG